MLFIRINNIIQQYNNIKMSLERTESVSLNIENVENNVDIIEELDDDTMIENNAFEIIKNIEKLRAEQKEKMNKIKTMKTIIQTMK